ncbi:MAG TPA: AAA family ATPase, partial [Candidatus Binataceae bacterium]|nr:AAA family ATPase [Candidatus Binataceae bacterium]
MARSAADDAMTPSRCAICAQENPAGGRFCVGCGARLPLHCAVCQTLLPFDAKFCSACGAPIVPNAIASAAESSDREGERRQLTVLFCDMVGSTEMAGRLDVEDYHQVVRLYQDAAAGAIGATNGHVAQYLGDGIVAYFGWPTAYGDDAERAVRAGLEIVAALERVNRNLRDDRKIAARVGIHTGRVVLGAIGVGARRETAALGETPNLAARVQSLAGSGEVLITEATNRLVGGRFLVEGMGAVPIKGLHQPVSLYRVKQATGLRNPLHASHPSSEFVGRVDELRALNEGWTRTIGGAPAIVLLRGEAGIGKSRLVHHFYETLRSQPHIWFEGYCSPFAINTPFAPLVEALSRVFILRDDTSPHQAFARIRRAMEGVGVNPEHAMPVIAEMFNLELPPGYAPLVSSPEQKRRRFIEVFGEWFLRLARRQPLVCLVEDIQWIDPSTREMIDYVIERGASAPFMLLYTARQDFTPWWPEHPSRSLIELGRLDHRDTVALAKASATGCALTDTTIEMVAERSGGNPLFIEELARVVAEQKGDIAANRDIPATIADSLMARLDGLGNAREIAQVAAVIGRDFSYSILRHLAQLEDAPLVANLQQLIESDLIHARGTPPEARYTFKHALLRDAAYDSLLRSRRRALHGRVARVLTEQPQGHPDTAPERMAYHWSEAGRADEASKAWQAAGDQIARRGALIEAAAHFTKALEALAEAPPSDQRDQREMSLLMTLGSILSATKGLASSEAETAFDRARQLGRRIHPDRAAALLGTWQMHVTRGEATAAQELAEQRLKIAEAENTPLALCWSHLA